MKKFWYTIEFIANILLLACAIIHYVLGEYQQATFWIVWFGTFSIFGLLCKWQEQST